MNRTQPANAFTVDVEDYFQVSAFAPHIPRSHWDQKECRVAERDDGIPVIIVAAVKKSERKGASDRSIQTLRSDTYFVSYCTDGLIARRRTGVHTT